MKQTGLVQRPSDASVLITSALTATTTGIALLWLIDPSVMDDDKAVEASQAVLLAIACLIHFVQAKSEASDVQRQVRFGLSLLCFSMFLREVDIDKLAETVWMDYIENTLRLIAVALWVVFAVRLRTHIPELWRQKFPIALGPTMLCSFAGVYFYLFSYPFDKEWMDIATEVNDYAEGVFELHATTMFLAGALLPVFREKSDRAGNGPDQATEDATKSGPDRKLQSGPPRR